MAGRVKAGPGAAASVAGRARRRDLLLLRSQALALDPLLLSAARVSADWVSKSRKMECRGG
jgi:hypothetical protein